MAESSAPVAGVDGCRGGWVAALLTGERLEWRFCANAAEVLALEVAAVGIDVPIGLPQTGPRAADVAARRVVRPRPSSVFPAPVRAVLGATTYAEACARSRAANDGKAISLQAFHILPKIADVDAHLSPEDQRRVVEVHPEVSFALLAGRVLGPKKRSPGRAERLTVLAAVVPDIAARLADKPRQAAPDDALDAVVAAWSARRWRDGCAVVLPDADPPRDARGLRMEIVA